MVRSFLRSFATVILLFYSVAFVVAGKFLPLTRTVVDISLDFDIGTTTKRWLAKTILNWIVDRSTILAVYRINIPYSVVSIASLLNFINELRVSTDSSIHTSRMRYKAQCKRTHNHAVAHDNNRFLSVQQYLFWYNNNILHEHFKRIIILFCRWFSYCLSSSFHIYFSLSFLCFHKFTWAYE